ncbi:hypothetical protein IEQ34_010706 [Dendrobium chrysotoxum]|uniref:Uncharacterized protein n=1 Tax=Dendrobium chrysotoxum TaxID=161865 RepID=A0AAV7GWE7_DENCH|nr:hypothetical protein IEQ34_010706 [Dendrobium chrysotoxum]
MELKDHVLKLTTASREETVANKETVMFDPSRMIEFDVNKNCIGSGHNRYHVVPFGGKTTRFRGPQVITVYPTVPFGGETAIHESTVRLSPKRSKYGLKFT